LDHLLLVRYAWVPHTHVVFAEVFKQKRAIRSMLLELFAESLPSASLLTFLYQATVEVCKTADLFLAVLERWLRSLATISQALPHVFPLRRSTVEGREFVFLIL
jgi:hypothetical protein